MKKIIMLFVVALGFLCCGSVEAHGPRCAPRPFYAPRPFCGPRIEFHPVWPVYRPHVHIHVRIPLYRSIWCAPVYETVIVRYDECGRPVYESICIRAGYYQSIVCGYRYCCQ